MPPCRRRHAVWEGYIIHHTTGQVMKHAVKQFRDDLPTLQRELRNAIGNQLSNTQQHNSLSWRQTTDFTHRVTKKTENSLAPILRSVTAYYMVSPNEGSAKNALMFSLLQFRPINQLIQLISRKCINVSCHMFVTSWLIYTLTVICLLTLG